MLLLLPLRWRLLPRAFDSARLRRRFGGRAALDAIDPPEADAPMGRKLWIFAIVFVLALVLTFYTMAKSKRLSDFLDVLSDERATTWQKVSALGLVWRRNGD